jgi:hypothetical protein
MTKLMKEKGEKSGQKKSSILFEASSNDNSSSVNDDM